VDAAGLAAEMLATAVNTNSHTFEVAPVFTLMEHHLLDKIAKTLGGPYALSHDGLMLAGGSLSNIYALQLARFW
jgi:glutamate/tyrosine decarboxylase-like PLP-dependent enzyme